jgi:hypothetical protein
MLVFIVGPNWGFGKFDGLWSGFAFLVRLRIPDRELDGLSDAPPLKYVQVPWYSTFARRRSTTVL